MYGVTIVRLLGGGNIITPPKNLFSSEKIKKITYLILPFESATPSVPPLHSMIYKKRTGILTSRQRGRTVMIY